MIIHYMDDDDDGIFHFLYIRIHMCSQFEVKYSIDDEAVEPFTEYSMRLEFKIRS